MRGQRAIVTLTSVMFALMLAVGSGEARPRIAFLSLGAAQEGATLVAAFADGLRRLGYAEGQNVDIDYRYAAGEVEQLKSLAQDLIVLKPDMLVGSEPSAARALKSVAPTLPIVCLAPRRAHSRPHRELRAAGRDGYWDGAERRRCDRKTG